MFGDHRQIDIPPIFNFTWLVGPQSHCQIPTKYTEFTWHCGYKVTHVMSLQHTRIRSCSSDKCVVSVHPLLTVELLVLFAFVLFSFVRPNVSKKPEKFCSPLPDLEVVYFSISDMI